MAAFSPKVVCFQLEKKRRRTKNQHTTLKFQRQRREWEKKHSRKARKRSERVFFISSHGQVGRETEGTEIELQKRKKGEMKKRKKNAGNDLMPSPFSIPETVDEDRDRTEQNNYLPFLPAGGTFSPLETWEGKPPLEVCQLPPVGPRAL